MYKDGRPILSSLLKVSRSVINHVLSEPNIIENSCPNFFSGPNVGDVVFSTAKEKKSTAKFALRNSAKESKFFSHC